MIKTFRGVIPHGGQDTIVLHTNTGGTGYRIKNFQVIAKVPGTTSHESVIKIYKVKQTTVDGVINLADNQLLGAAFATALVSQFQYDQVIIFDQETFNQDIYVTLSDVSGNDAAMNYYIELEQIKLDMNQNTVATLKDIRNVTGAVSL